MRVGRRCWWNEIPPFIRVALLRPSGGTRRLAALAIHHDTVRVAIADRETSTNCGRAISHAIEAQSGESCRGLRETGSVISHFDSNPCGVDFERKDDMFRLRMLQRVIEGLLGNSIQLIERLQRHPERSALGDSKFHPPPSPGIGALDRLTERPNQRAATFG